MNGAALAAVSGLAAIVVALWIGVGTGAGCVALGAAGVALIVTAVAAVVPDRRARR